MQKRIISILMAAAMLLMLAPTAVAAGEYAPAFDTLYIDALSDLTVYKFDIQLYNLSETVNIPQENIDLYAQPISNFMIIPVYYVQAGVLHLECLVNPTMFPIQHEFPDVIIIDLDKNGINDPMYFDLQLYTDKASLPVAAAGDLTLFNTPTATDGAKGSVDVELQLAFKGGSPIGRLSYLEITPIYDDPNQYPFEIDGVPTATLNNLTAGSGTAKVIFPFRVKSATENGYYEIKFKAKYLGAFQNPVTDTPVETTLITYVNITKGRTPKDEQPSGETPAVSVPKVILSAYTINPEQALAGQPFDVVLTLTNTSTGKDITNLTGTLEEAESILAQMGGNIFYISRIPAGESVQQTVTMLPLANTKPQPYSLGLKLSYEYTGANGVADADATGAVTVSVVQPSRLTLDMPVVMPTEMMVGDQFNIMMKIMNMGKGTLYNVMAKVIGDEFMPDSSYFAGNMESGASKEMDLMVTLLSGEGEAPGKVEVTYEDETGEQFTLTQDFTVMAISSGESWGEVQFTDDGVILADGTFLTYEEYDKMMGGETAGAPGGMGAGLSVWAWVGIVAAACALIVGGVVFLRIRRGKRARRK